MICLQVAWAWPMWLRVALCLACIAATAVPLALSSAAARTGSELVWILAGAAIGLLGFGLGQWRSGGSKIASGTKSRTRARWRRGSPTRTSPTRLRRRRPAHSGSGDSAAGSRGGAPTGLSGGRSGAGGRCCSNKASGGSTLSLKPAAESSSASQAASWSSTRPLRGLGARFVARAVRTAPLPGVDARMRGRRVPLREQQRQKNWRPLSTPLRM